MKLKIKFHLTDTKKTCYIEKDKLTVILANDKDITMFKYYHLLDVFGVVKNQHSSTYVHDKTDTRDGYNITTLKPVYTHDPEPVGSYYDN